MIKPIIIPTDKIEDVWSLVDEHITNALLISGRHYEPDDIKKKCMDATMQLWIGWDDELTPDKAHCCTLVTEILDRPNTRVFSLYIMTGKRMREWVKYMDVLLKYAIHKECTHMEAWARPGWERILKKFDYKKSHVLLERKL